MTRARGEGSIFQARYKDRQGEWRTARTWTLQYYDRRLRDHITKGGFRTEAEAARALTLALRGGPVDFTAAEFRVFSGPIVYVWLRGRVVLYVGMSSCGLGRPLSRRHHVMQLLDGDSVRVWPCNSTDEAVALERRLIRRLKPQLNTQRSFS